MLTEGKRHYQPSEFRSKSPILNSGKKHFQPELKCKTPVVAEGKRHFHPDQIHRPTTGLLDKYKPVLSKRRR